MNLKLKAILQTIVFFVVAGVAGVLGQLLPMYVVGIIACAGLFYLVYSLFLNRLEFDKKVEDIGTKIK